jgi:hypothetical protein
MVCFTSRPLYPWGIALGTHWIESWLGPRSGLDAAEKRQILTLPGIETLRSSQSVYNVLQHTQRVGSRFGAGNYPSLMHTVCNVHFETLRGAPKRLDNIVSLRAELNRP